MRLFWCTGTINLPAVLDGCYVSSSFNVPYVHVWKDEEDEVEVALPVKDPKNWASRIKCAPPNLDYSVGC